MNPRRAEANVEKVRSRFTELFDDDVEDIGENPDSMSGEGSEEPNQGDHAIQPPSKNQSAQDSPGESQPENLDPKDKQSDTHTSSSQEVEFLKKENADLQQELAEAQKQIASLQEKMQKLANEVDSDRDIDSMVDPMAFIKELRKLSATRPRGTNHVVSESIDKWIEDVRHELNEFGRSKGPNEAQWLWNIGMFLLKRGLEADPGWVNQVKEHLTMPDMALVEVYKLAVKGLRKSS